MSDWEWLLRITTPIAVIGLFPTVLAFWWAIVFRLPVGERRYGLRYAILYTVVIALVYVGILDTPHGWDPGAAYYNLAYEAPPPYQLAITVMFLLALAALCREIRLITAARAEQSSENAMRT